jgi:hypothetical protein
MQLAPGKSHLGDLPDEILFRILALSLDPIKVS